MPVEFSKPAYFVRRKLFDNFLAQNSKAEICDGTLVTGMTQDNEGRHVVLQCERGGLDLTFSSKFVVGADGSDSKMQRLVDNAFWKRHVEPYRFFMGKVHYQGQLELDKE